MIHPDTQIQFISEAKGHGVVATKLIPAGTITWVQDRLDRKFTTEDFNSFDPIYQDILETYTFRDRHGDLVLCWDIGRFVNHSFKSNCLTTAYDFEIAIRDIQPGEELTDDYGYLNITEPFEAENEGTDRKVVYPDDLVHFYKVWDAKLRAVFHKIIQHDQPLKKLIDTKIWRKVEDVASGEKKMDSILLNYYDQKSSVEN
ncbi:MAG: SET domain-containing protein [Leeuwenhoekiella sp.]